MGLIRFAIDNPVKVAVGVILLTLFGLVSVLNVGIQLTPDVDRPVITVKTSWQGASPQEIENEIVERQEDKLKSVSGLEKMSSSSTEGSATITLEFPVGIDKDTAFADVSDKLRQVSGYPEEVDEPTVSKTDSDMEGVIAWMMLYSDDGEDISHMKKFVEDNVKPILERAEGISEVSVYGGREREVQVVVDPHRLASRGLTMLDVDRALRGQNENVSAGTTEQGKREYTFRTLGEFRELEDVSDTVIAYDRGGPIFIRDVAEIVDGFKKPVSFVRSKGRPVIAIPARRETGANVIETMENLRRQIEIVNKDLLVPRGLGLELSQVYDETTYIWSSIGLVVKNIFVGGLLAVIVLLLFLRSGSATGIIGVAIPISVIGTLLVITLLGRSINVVLLAGLAFAVGMVVDNAIVVLENIYRHRGMGKSRKDAALDGAHEVWGAVLASTLTTMVVFIPVVTIEDEAGQLFKDIAIAIASAVGLSLIVSILVIPPLAARFFAAEHARKTGDKPWRFAQLVASIVGVINQTTARRVGTVALISAAAIGLSIRLMPPTEYLPAGNKNLVMGFLSSPPGYSIEEYRRMALIVEEGDPNDPTDGLRPYWEADLGSEQAASLPPVEMKLGREGKQTRTITPPPIFNFFFVSFDGGAFMGATSKDEDNVKPLETVLSSAGQRVPGVFAMFNQASLFQSGGPRSSGNAIALEIRSENLDDVAKAASAIRMKLMEKGYTRPRATPPNFDLGRPEIQLIPDRAKAADLGLAAADIGFIARACVDGAFVGEFNDRGDKIDMALKVGGTEQANLSDIGEIPIYAPSGDIVPLDSVVTFDRTTAPQQILRIEQMSAVSLAVTPKAGVALQTTMDEIQDEVIAPLRQGGAIPDGVITSLAGTADKLTQTQRALIGDFRGLVRHPQVFGFGVAPSLLILVMIALAVAGVLWPIGGLPVSLKVGGALLALVAIAFLGLNLEMTVMALQSRAILALVITFLLMAALFESFVYPFVIMLSVPLAAVGGFAALAIVHDISFNDVRSPVQQLDVLTMLGFVILIGIVVNNAILLVHQSLTFMRRDRMNSTDAVTKSVLTRTRPIFMGAFTSVFGMMPLVVMPGAGSELYRGLGSVVLGGLLVSTVFTLVVVPSLLTLVLDVQAWATARAKNREEAAPGGVVAAHAPRDPAAPHRD